MMHNLEVRCPRRLDACGVCGAPATTCIQGPPTNPAARREWGGLTFMRCDPCAAAFDVAVVYDRYPPGKVQVSRTDVATCGAVVLVPVDVSLVHNGEPPEEDVVPTQCRHGHVFTHQETQDLHHQARQVFGEWVLSGEPLTLLGEAMCTRGEE